LRASVGRSAWLCASGAGLALAAVGAAAGVAGAQGGGAVFVSKPEVDRVSCTRKCASRERARGGSIVKVAGHELGDVTRVLFLGTTGRSDDVEAKVRRATSTRVRARVPSGAVTGPIAVKNAAGARSPASRSVPILPPLPPAPNPDLTPAPGPRAPGAPLLETGTSRTRVFIGARKAVSFSYRVQAPAPVGVRVDLVRAGDGATVKTWTPAPVTPGQVGTVNWSGRLGKAGAPNGRYSFRLTASGQSGAIARSAQAQGAERDAFDLYDHRFPIRGRHDYGGGGGLFGAGRGGRSHQGQDVFARCGAPLVAARGGRVQYSGYHGAAGYYVVIDGAGTGEDYAYMHLAERSPFRARDRVYTGQRIGSVGDSGNARGCHLHFEIWGAPGWYEGGRPFDPLPSLRAWNAWS
jgi:murein DD-endopeptidase MepM/ murein hydrolase activator NlpD